MIYNNCAYCVRFNYLAKGGQQTISKMSGRYPFEFFFFLLNLLFVRMENNALFHMFSIKVNNIIKRIHCCKAMTFFSGFYNNIQLLETVSIIIFCMLFKK